MNASETVSYPFDLSVELAGLASISSVNLAPWLRSQAIKSSAPLSCATVHQVQDLSGRESAKLLCGFKFRGGGGTDFRQAIAEAAVWKPDLLIYLTDLEGDACAEPAFPVLWAVPEGRAEAPWGKIVELS
jgi:hypothetical protein